MTLRELLHMAMELAEKLSPAMPLLLLLFRSVREWIKKQYRKLRPYSLSDVMTSVKNDVNTLRAEFTAEFAAMSIKTDRLLHEVLPNNGGSMRDEMRRTFAKLMTVLSSSSEGQALFDVEGRLDWANEPFMRWTGRSEADLKSHGWLSAVVERDQKDFQERFENAVKKQIEFRAKCLMRGTSPNELMFGGIVYFTAEWRVVPVRDPATRAVIAFSAEVRRVLDTPQHREQAVYEDND